ncbi:MAG: hypothetical protein JWL90_3779 [Chthoniobacteraceae bacterium]|nr:hypothetical protein [Chthoniobacteraceae bacterium]
MKPPVERVVIPSTTKRDAFIAAVCGLLVLGFIIYGIGSMMSQSKQARSTTLTGVILEKRFTAAPEQQISVGGKGLRIKEIEGEYVLKVRAGVDDRVFEVPVQKNMYELKSVGDTLTFRKPESEAR